MPSILIPILLYLTWIGFNTFFIGIIKRAISHPKYSLPITEGDFKIYSTLILFIGLPLLLFRKRLRRRRIKEFYEYVSERDKTWIDFGVVYGVRITTEEIDELGRSLKLEEIKRKTRKKW